MPLNHAPVFGVLLITLSTSWLIGCSKDDNTTSAASDAYLTQEGCTFSVHTGLTSASMDSESNADTNFTSTQTLTLNGITVKLSDCQIIENPMNLPVLDK